MITTLRRSRRQLHRDGEEPRGPVVGADLARDFDGIDPSLFFDDDGRAYIVNNGPPVGKAAVRRTSRDLDSGVRLAAQKLVGPRKVIVNGGVDLSKKPIWIEAPHILKVEGRSTILICAEGGTADQHSEVVFKATRCCGPYTPGPNNPILTQRHSRRSHQFAVTSTGHADFVQTPRGRVVGGLPRHAPIHDGHV